MRRHEAKNLVYENDYTAGQLKDHLRRNPDPESLLDAGRQFGAEDRIQPQVVREVGICFQGFLGYSQGFADQNLGLVI